MQLLFPIYIHAPWAFKLGAFVLTKSQNICFTFSSGSQANMSFAYVIPRDVQGSHDHANSGKVISKYHTCKFMKFSTFIKCLGKDMPFDDDVCRSNELNDAIVLQ